MKVCSSMSVPSLSKFFSHFHYTYNVPLRPFITILHPHPCSIVALVFTSTHNHCKQSVVLFMLPLFTSQTALYEYFTCHRHTHTRVMPKSLTSGRTASKCLVGGTEEMVRGSILSSARVTATVRRLWSTRFSVGVSWEGDIVGCGSGGWPVPGGHGPHGVRQGGVVGPP